MKTRSLYLLAAIGGAALVILASPQPTSGQNPQAEISPQMAALIAEVTAQSKQLAANQAEIDARLDQLGETVRQARLFAARGGGRGGAK